MKKLLIILLFIILIIPTRVFATSGYLRNNSIKECPNGKTYGRHGDGHWHLASKDGSRYKAKGSAFYYDPCPPKNTDDTLGSLKVDGKYISISNTMSYTTYNSSITISAKANDSKARVKHNYSGLKVGTNKITITVTAEDGSKRNYILNVTRKKVDTSLKSLKVDGKNIAIKNTMSYVTYNPSIKIEPVATDSNSKVSTNYKSLALGTNKITITVTAPNGSKKNYILNVNYKKADTSLKSLKVDGKTITIKDTMSYETFYKTLKIEALANDANSKVTTNYKELEKGDNKITITVTAPNGAKKDYILNVLSKKMDTTLKSLKIDDNEIELTKELYYESYNNKISIEAIPTDSTVTVTNDYKELVEGENIITIKLTAKNGDISEYKLKVLLKKADTTIKTLKIDDDEVELGENLSYETIFKNINIEVTPNDPNTSVTIDNKELVDGENVIAIVLTAPNGETAEYKLNVLLKKADTTIKSLKVDDEWVEPSEIMNYESYKEDVKLEIIPNDSTASVSDDYNYLKMGENIINITVTAKNGESSEYKLIIERLKKDGPGEATIKKFILGNTNIEFKDNNAVYKIKDVSDILEYSYELSSEKAKITMYVNDELVTSLNNIKNGDTIKLVVTDEYNNDNIYYIKVATKSSIPNYAIYGPAALVTLATGITISKKRKKTS